MNNRPALCMGTAGRASVESLHALDSYQQSMPVNRAHTVWKSCLWHVNSGHLQRWCCMLIGEWRKWDCQTGELDELSWFIRGCNSTAIASVSQTELVYTSTTIAVDFKCKVLNEDVDKEGRRRIVGTKEATTADLPFVCNDVGPV